LPIQKLKEHTIYLPSLEEQQRIVSELDTLQFNRQKLETIYQQNLNALTELKQSILQKAFSGELTEDLPL
jgi:type I restriction enzyme S subunit